MQNTSVPFDFEYSSDGERFARVPLRKDREFVFQGKKLESVNIVVFEGDGNLGVRTSLKDQSLDLSIPLSPEEFSDLEENPTAVFEIDNNFEIEGWEGVTLDKWTVSGHNWSRDVWNDQQNSLEGMVLFTFYGFEVEVEEPLAA